MRFCRERDVPSGCKKSFEQHKLRYSGNLLDMIEAIQFSSLREFFEMGGYAFNVWSVYAIFAVFVSVNIAMPVFRKEKIIRELKRRASFENAETDSVRES